MQLSAQLFSEIIGDLSSESSLTATNDERRQSPRASLGRRARVYPLLLANSPDGQPVLVRDISIDGIGMLISEPMSSGDEFVLHLPLYDSPFGTDPLQIQCTTRRCQPGGSGQTQFFIGATFELVLNRPLRYAAELPPELSGHIAELEPAAKTLTDKWDPCVASPAESRFDEQMAESMANRPQRVSLQEFLTQYALGRWMCRLTWRGLAPVATLLNRLGIRSRLASGVTTAPTEAGGFEAISQSVDNAIEDDSAIPYKQRSMITALDSASHYVPGIEDTLPPAPLPPSTLEQLSNRRSSLFVKAVETPASSAEHVASEAAAQMAPITSELPVESPAVVVKPLPEFELPALLPPPAVIEQAVSAPSLQLDGLSPLPITPALSVPPPNDTAKRSNAAWRSRHRSTLNQSTRNRPKPGR